MKPLVYTTLVILLAACDKEAPQRPSPNQPSAVAKPTPAKPKALTVPQGKLPKMDPEKAKFIAAPSTPEERQPDKSTEKATGDAKSAPRTHP